MNRLRSFRSLLGALARRDRFEARMSDEIRFHLDAYVEELVRAGVSRHEAERRARIEFGGVEPVKDACRQARGLRVMDELRQDLSYGFRSLAKNPGFAATAIGTLALGIGATTAIFSVVYAVLVRPLPFPDPDRIVQIVINAPPLPDGSGPSLLPLPFEDFAEVRAQSRTISDLSIYSAQSLTLTGHGNPVRISGARVSPSLLRLLGASPDLGRLFEPAEETPGNDRVVLLGRSMWERRFNSDPDIVGRAVLLDGALYTVVGVMPGDFRFPDAETEFWVPFALDPVRYPRVQGRVTILGPSIARLTGGISIEQATAEIQTIFARLHGPVLTDAPADPLPDGTVSGRGRGPAPPPPAAGAPPGGRGGPGRMSPPGSRLAEARIELVPLQEQIVRDIRPALLVLLGSVGFVLMIACVNVANLLLTRAGGRHLEIAIRVALGAGRTRLIRQVLTESVLLAAAGGAVGILIAYAGVGVLNGVDPGWIPRMEEVDLSVAVLAFAVGTSLVTGLLFGLAPGLRLLGTESARSLNEGRMHAASGLDLFGRNRMRGALAAGEVALAIILLIGGGLLIHSFTKLAALDPGYDPENVLTFSVSLPQARYDDFSRRSAFYDQVLGQIRQLPSVRAAGGTSTLPLSPAGFNIFLSFAGVEQFISARARVVTPDYFETMGIPLVEGRLFTDREPEGSILVNETFQRRYFPEGAVGRELSAADRTWRVVGVVGDVRLRNGLEGDIEPEFRINYKDLPSTPFVNMPLTLAVRTTGEPEPVADEIRRIVAGLDPSLALEDVRTMEDRLYASIAEPRFYAVSLGIFAAVALALAAVGIYGVLSYAVSQRTREIGIRMALGAQRRAVLGMVLSQGMTLTLVGVAAGLLAALAVTRYLEGMLFGLTPLDPATFFATTGIIVLTALVACYVPARRALRIDPVTALRHE